MQSAEVIVIGAGAAGLMVARTLGEAGKEVIILEARDRAGGRIHSIDDKSFSRIEEAGAEFIHGDLPVTFELFKQASIGHRISGGDSWHFTGGKLLQDRDDDDAGDTRLLTKKLSELKKDLPVADFLNTHFSGDEHSSIRETVKGFVEGYDAADINRASTFTLRKEWEEINEGDQYRVEGGYIQMIRYLENECLKYKCISSFSSVVKEIKWQQGNVEITTGNHQRYTAKMVVVTIPIGVLCAQQDAEAAIHFSPSLTGKEISFKALGYGGVIKILLEFDHAFWKDLLSDDGKRLKNMGWIFSDQSIPTWWTQAPDKSATLTGWLAGPKARNYKDADDSIIFNEAIVSLSNIFRIGTNELKNMLVHSRVENWLADPFSLGAYSFATPETSDAVKQLIMPIENTVFFAGEALYDGPEIGTVEAALANGLKVGKMVLENS